jgi:hypothetical protein
MTSFYREKIYIYIYIYIYTVACFVFASFIASASIAVKLLSMRLKCFLLAADANCIQV